MSNKRNEENENGVSLVIGILVGLGLSIPLWIATYGWVKIIVRYFTK